ncbi:MAG: hypothetical protein LBP53_04795 [Candidatus Peribacteria bacterium]|jgi:hypothetical protein|nr:hypothetical protein [Candidatus Peribacteria bacterium]
MQIGYNPSTTTSILRDKEKQIDVFQGVNHHLTLHFPENAVGTYAVFLDYAQLSLTVVPAAGAKVELFAFVVASSLQVATKLQASHTSVNVHLIGLQYEGASVQMQGSIDIAP